MPSVLHPYLLQLLNLYVCAKGQQSLSEEVSQSTHSRMLWLERENQRLLSTIEELQADPLRSSSQLKYSQQLEHHQVICKNSSTSCKQKTFQRCLQAQQINEDASSQQLHQGETKEVLSQFIKGPDLREESQPEDLVSELEDFENDPNKRCSGESRESITSHDLTHQSTRSSYFIKQSQRLEAKCRALDTVNQHLQSALDNSGTLCSSIHTHTHTQTKKKHFFSL